MSVLWYFTTAGKKMEPVTATELEQLAMSGHLQPNDLVWKEGMEAWAKASTITGLIPANVRPQSDSIRTEAPRADAARSRSDDDDRPRRRRNEEDDNSRRLRKPAPGMSGLAIGLIIGGGIAVVLLVIVGIAIFAVRSRGAGAIADYTVNLGVNQFHTRNFSFKAGSLYELRVTSDQDTDVDLHIKDLNNNLIAADISVGPSSLIEWSPAATGDYRIEVANLDLERFNRSHVVIRNLGPSAGPVVRVPAAQPQIGPQALNRRPPFVPNFPKVPPPNVPIVRKFQEFPKAKLLPKPGPVLAEQTDVIAPNSFWQKTVSYPIARLVEVKVTSDDPANDVDLVVFDRLNQRIASDELVSPHCAVTFPTTNKGVYRMQVKNHGPNPARCTIMYTQP